MHNHKSFIECMHNHKVFLIAYPQAARQRIMFRLLTVSAQTFQQCKRAETECCDRSQAGVLMLPTDHALGSAIATAAEQDKKHAKKTENRGSFQVLRHSL